MFSFLVRIVGQYRAEVLRYYVREYAVLGIAGILGIAGMTALVLRFDPEKYVHDGYNVVGVTGIFHDAGVKYSRVIVGVVLPDGSRRNLIAVHGSTYGSISDRACVERRRSEASEYFRYRLVPAQKCKDW